MYINKMIFMERDDFKTDDKEKNLFLEDYLMQETDYGSVEITADHIKELLEEAEDYNSFEKSPDEIEAIIKEAIGEEVFNMLFNEELDFIQVLY